MNEKKLSLYTFLVGPKPEVVFEYMILATHGEFRVIRQEHDEFLQQTTGKVMLWQAASLLESLEWLFNELRNSEVEFGIYPHLTRANVIHITSYVRILRQVSKAVLEDDLVSINLIGSMNKYSEQHLARAKAVLEIQGYPVDVESEEPRLIVLRELIRREPVLTFN